MTQADEYKVQLDVYSGPLELLLYLIKKEEVEVKDIPIARITEQYLKHVEIIRRIDINLAGEFLVMAATLMEIKSRMLIPRPVANPDDPNAAPDAAVEDLADPRAELVRQLLAYKAFKDAASDLKRRAETEAARYPRAVGRPTTRTPLDIDDLNLFALIDAFNAIMTSIGHSAFGHEVVYDDTPISLHQADILDRLERLVQEQGAAGAVRGLSLRELFAGRTTKSEVIGVFLATLELMRQKKVKIEQPGLNEEPRVVLREGEDEQVLFATPAHEAAPAREAAEVSDAPAEVAQEEPEEDDEDLEEGEDDDEYDDDDDDDDEDEDEDEDEGEEDEDNP